MADRKAYLQLATLVALWCFALLIPPIIAAVEGPSTAQPVYQAFSRICHQSESRSIYMFGYPLAVCARCSSLYFGFFLGVAVSAMIAFRPKNFRLWFALTLVPMLLDVLLDELGIHGSTLSTRIVTGSVFGVGSGVLLAPILVEAFRAFLVSLQRTQHAKT